MGVGLVTHVLQSREIAPPQRRAGPGLAVVVEANGGAVACRIQTHHLWSDRLPVFGHKEKHDGRRHDQDYHADTAAASCHTAKVGPTCDPGNVVGE